MIEYPVMLRRLRAGRGDFFESIRLDKPDKAWTAIGPRTRYFSPKGV